MRIFDGADFSAVEPGVVTIGSFDGVHLGHRAILSRLGEEAARLGAARTVVTFAEHPRKVLGQDADRLSLLTTAPEKRVLLEACGVDQLVELRFTPRLAGMDAEVFVKDFLLPELRMRGIIMGYDHRFGHDKKGTYPFLKTLGEKLGFGASVVAEQSAGSANVSSTAIRNLLAAGDVARAAELLTYPYRMTAGVGADGAVKPADPEKLVPGRGLYRVSVGAFPAELAIGADKRMRIAGEAFPEGEQVIRFEKNIGENGIF